MAFILLAMKIDYYVYAYLRKDDLTPYYIGKGRGGRAFHSSTHTIKVPTEKSRIVFLETNLTNIGSLALERRMIRWYGRKDLRTGTLRNMTDGGDGVAGVTRSEEYKANMRKIMKKRFEDPELKEKLRQSKIDKRPSDSDATRKKKRESALNRDPRPQVGKKVSDAKQGCRRVYRPDGTYYMVKPHIDQ